MRALVRALAIAVLVAAPARAATRPLPPHAHFAELRGIRVYYVDVGRGAPLLLLHGGAGDGDQFEHQLEPFGARYRLIVPDACAQGRTTDRPGPLTYHDMAEDALALLDRLKLRRVRVVGWSDGGNVGLDLAMHHPERVSHLVTFGANFRADGLEPADVAWNDTARAESFGEGTAAWYREKAPDPSHYRAAMTKILSLWRTQPQWAPADLGRVRAKTLVVAGEHDVVRRDHTEALARAIPGAKLWIVPGANHSVMVERWRDVNPVVLDFLAR